MRSCESSPRSDADVSPWKIQAGMILEVRLKNFMCHQELVYRPNQRLNFLCGDNGSGKSAVLTAIVFGLGGSARTAMRGSANKGFVRSGQNTASVEIKLDNRGDNCYRPELYGKSLTVARTVTTSGSGSYKLKDDRGTVVVERRVKEELDRILSTFLIQVDNPIAILNQDYAKTFLFSCDPSKLYEFFMRATQLQDIRDDYNKAADERAIGQRLLAEKMETFGELKAELQIYKRKYDLLQTLKSKKEGIGRMKSELAWAEVIMREKGLEEASAVVEETNAKIAKNEEQADKFMKLLKTLNKEKVEIDQRIQKIAAKIDSVEAEVDKCKREAKLKKDAEMKLAKLMQEIGRRKKAKMVEKEALEKAVNDLRNADTSEYEKNRSSRQKQIEALQANVSSVEAQHGTSLNHLQHLTENAEEGRSKKDELTAKRGAVLRKRQEHEAQLRQIQSSSGREGRIGLFGPKMPQLVAEVGKNKRAFKKPPIGPIGAYIKLKPGTNAKASAVIETELSKGFLASFLVDNFEDKKSLQQIAKRLNVFVSVICSRFLPAAHDVSGGRVDGSSRGFSAIIDHLDVDNVNVANSLIDNKQVEKILIVPDERQAQELLKSSPPRNCLYACTHGSGGGAGGNYGQYYPAPNYRAYTKRSEGQSRLEANTEHLVASLKSQIALVNAELADREKQLEDHLREFQLHETERASEQKKVASLRAKIMALNRDLMALRNEDAADTPPDVAALEEDMDRWAEDIAEMERDLAGHAERHEELSEEAGVARKRYEEQLTDFETNYTGQREPLEEELGAKEMGIENSVRARKHHLDKRSEYMDRLKAAQTKRDAKRAAVDEAMTAGAAHLGDERIATRKTTKKIAEEIAAAQEAVRKQEQNQEKPEVVMAKYTKLRNNYRRITNTCNKEQGHLDKLGTMLEKRREGFQTIRKSICKKVMFSFGVHLNAQKFHGQLRFNHTDRLLEITVLPDGEGAKKRDLKSLSGGEKSYSTVSLILSLWDSISTPFRLLDEFDVFMDAVRRRIALDSIILYAKAKRQYQYVFLTPLNTDNVGVGEDLAIIRLQKNQG